MKNRLILLAGLGAMALSASCSKSSGEAPAPRVEPGQIRAVATMQSIEDQTKAAYTATDAVGMKAWVLTTQTRGDFGSYTEMPGNGKLYSKGTMTFAAGEVAYDQAGLSGSSKLPTDGSSLWAVAIYPATLAVNQTPSYNSSRAISAIFQGTEDVMSSAPREIKKEAGSDVAAFEFKHLLTKIDVKLKAQDAQAAAAWGNVQEIVLRKKNNDAFWNRAEISHETGTAPTAIGTGTVGGFGTTSGAPTTWPLFKNDNTDTKFANQSLALTTSADFTTQDVVATTLVAPMIATADVDGDIIVEVTTMMPSGSLFASPVPIAIPAGDTQGKAYTIHLTFNALDITGTATVEAWKSGGDIVHDVN